MGDLVEADPRPVVELMREAQRGDREAFAELQRIGKERGVSFTEGWSARMILLRLQDRASPTNLLARAAVEDDLESAVRELSRPGDGPIERLLVGRAALCAVDASRADFEHLAMIGQAKDPRDAEVYDRRRDRAQRRLLATLKALAEARRDGRPAVRVRVTM